MDFQFDGTADGRRHKFMNVIDEHSRVCLAIQVDRRYSPRMWCWCCRRSPASTPRRHSSDPITGPNSSLKLYWASARTAEPSARPTSSQDPHGRTALPSRSTADSGMSSSTLSCSPQLRRRRSWPITGAGNTTLSAHIRPSRGVRPWMAAQQGAAARPKQPTFISPGSIKGVTS